MESRRAGVQGDGPACPNMSSEFGLEFPAHRTVGQPPGSKCRADGGNIFFADRRTVERQVSHAVHSIGRIVSRFRLRLTRGRGAALRGKRGAALQIIRLMLHMAPKLSGDHRPWRLLSY